MTTKLALEWHGGCDGSVEAAILIVELSALRLMALTDGKGRFRWHVYGEDYRALVTGDATSLEAAQLRAEKAARRVLREAAKALKGKR